MEDWGLFRWMPSAGIFRPKGGPGLPLARTLYPMQFRSGAGLPFTSCRISAGRAYDQRLGCSYNQCFFISWKDYARQVSSRRGKADVSSVNCPEERRQHYRHPVHVRVLVGLGQSILHGRSENISLDGACIRLDDVQPEDICVPVRFLTPYIEEFQYIDVMARVQYSVLTSGMPPYKVGVRFIGANTEVVRRIAVLTKDNG